MNRYFLKPFLVFFMLVATFLEGIVITSDEITDIHPYVDAHTLVVFDIDDTLIRSKTTLGNPACFYGLREHFISKEIFSEEETAEVFNTFDLLMQKHAQFEIIDQKAVVLISEYQEQGIDLIALTSRPMFLSEVTKGILEDQKIHLGENVNEHYRSFTLNREVLYDSGILFVGDHNKKSAVLDYFIHYIANSGKEYSRVVFVDDKKMYVEDIQKYVEANGLDYAGLYYVKEKERQRNIDLEVAIEQARQLIGFSRHRVKGEGRDSIDDPRLIQLFLNELPHEGEYFYMEGHVMPDRFIKGGGR